MIFVLGAPGQPARLMLVADSESAAEVQAQAGEVVLEAPTLSAWKISADGQGIEPMPTNLTTVAAEASAKVDVQAEIARNSIITSGSGQALTYMRKEAEARALIINPEVDAPLLTEEATALGIDLLDLAAEVITAADTWTTIAARIESARRKAKADIAAAQSENEIIALSNIDWDNVILGTPS